MIPLGPAALTRRFVLLTTLRWLPVGFTIPVTVLYALDRGLTLGEFGIAAATQGIVVLLLELPSGALADSWGRRPVLIVAAVFQVGALLVLSIADSPVLFTVTFALMGVFRAFDSGALEAWYADAALSIDPDTPLQRGLGAAGIALGVAISGGALASSGVILLAPIIGADPLLLPIGIACALASGQLIAVVLLLPEPRGRSEAAFGRALAAVPTGLVTGVRVLFGSRVLVALVAVEVFWGFGMWAFESLTPVRLDELVGDADAAAALMGPVSAAGWLLFAAGSAAAERLSRTIDVALIAVVFRLLQGAAVVAIGLATGPAGAVAAYLGCYLVHGGSGPLHSTLLHREVRGPTRATVLSINSMVSQPAASLGAILLGAVATGASVSVAFLIAGVVLAVAAPLYLPAIRRRRKDGRSSA